MRSPVALLLVAIGAALSGCGEAATAKVEVPLHTAPENDKKIVAVVPAGSAVKISKCSRGWCQVSWHGQNGYALAKNFSATGLEDSAADADSEPGDDDANDE